MQNSALSNLASEGERLCKLGDCLNGINYFNEALKLIHESQTATDDLKTLTILSVIYNQLGNAYFYLQDYNKALEYHKLDYEISERLNDDSGKAKACGNIGNTLQLLGDYDEAILYSVKNLEISIEHSDVTGEARALYNLGNIYQSKGKHMGRITCQSEDTERHFPQEITQVLEKAIYYYKKTLELVKSKKDRSAEGRTHGNLGNTYYLLGQFESAIECHLERLKIAKEFGDKSAERRAYSNLGNCHIFLAKYQESADFYLKAMNVARVIGDKAIEAQAYFSLGNVYSLIQDYTVAIDFHMRHLQIALLLEDRIGESRAYWSLGNAYAALGDIENAIVFAHKHLNLAKKIGDTTSELNARMNLYDYQNLLSCNSAIKDSESTLFTPISNVYNQNNFDRFSSLAKKSRSTDSVYQSHQNLCIQKPPVAKRESKEESKFQDKIESNESFFDILAKIQSNRLDDQRSSLRIKSKPKSENRQKENKTEMDDEFFNLVMKSQRSRLEDQRSSIAITNNGTKFVKVRTNDRLTVPPDDEFFSMLQKLQSRRLNEQRCVPK